MKNSFILASLTFCFVHLPFLAQCQSNVLSQQQENLKDSILYLYTSYNNLYTNFTKIENGINFVNNGLVGLQKDYNNLNGLLDENTKIVQLFTKDQIFTYRTQYYSRRDKIINTADFVETANNSLNLIILLDEVGEYLNEITSLNSPENQDLGFSLSGEILKILETKIIKGKGKLNGGKSTKIIDFVTNILKSPVTDAISKAIPVVSSIKSVVDLVMGAAVRGEDVSINDVADFKLALKDYIQHYEGLASALNKFDNTLNTLKVRKVALSQLLRQYTIERINSADPGSVASNDTSSLTFLINNKFNKSIMDEAIKIIEAKNNIPDIKEPDRTKENVYNVGLNDKRMIYPSSAENQARFIRDEILSVSNEYIAAYKEYQMAIEKVLRETLKKKIGTPELADKKIKTLNAKLNNVIRSFNISINAEQLNKKFDKIITY